MTTDIGSIWISKRYPKNDPLQLVEYAREGARFVHYYSTQRTMNKPYVKGKITGCIIIVYIDFEWLHEKYEKVGIKPLIYSQELKRERIKRIRSERKNYERL